MYCSTCLILFIFISFNPNYVLGDTIFVCYDGISVNQHKAHNDCRDSCNEHIINNNCTNPHNKTECIKNSPDPDCRYIIAPLKWVCHHAVSISRSKTNDECHRSCYELFIDEKCSTETDKLWCVQSNIDPKCRFISSLQPDCTNAISKDDNTADSVCIYKCEDISKLCESEDLKWGCFQSHNLPAHCSVDYYKKQCTYFNKKVSHFNEDLKFCGCRSKAEECSIVDVMEMDDHTFKKLQTAVCAHKNEINFHVVETYDILNFCTANSVTEFLFKKSTTSFPMYKFLQIGNSRSADDICLSYFPFCAEMPKEKEVEFSPFYEPQFDCLWDEFTEWTKCSLTCIEEYTDENGDIKLLKGEQKRTRRIIINKTSKDEEKCDDIHEYRECDNASSMPYCKNLCITSKWQEWEGCSVHTDFHGNKAKYITRYKHIYQYDSSCKNIETVQTQSCDNGELEVNSIASLKESHVNCVPLSQFSSCTVPCETNENIVGKRYRYGTVTNSSNICYVVDNCDPLPQCPSKENDVKCYLTLSIKSGENWIAKGSESDSHNSCICADENTTPCNIHEAYKSMDTWKEHVYKYCKTIESLSAENNLNGMAGDSQQYIVMADGWRVHCPLHYATDFTFSILKDDDVLNNFCKNGEKLWKSLIHDPLAHPDCETAKAISGDTRETEECKKVCKAAMQFCSAFDNADYVLDVCFYEDFKPLANLPTITEFFNTCYIEHDEVICDAAVSKSGDINDDTTCKKNCEQILDFYLKLYRKDFCYIDDLLEINKLPNMSFFYKNCEVNTVSSYGKGLVLCKDIPQSD